MSARLGVGLVAVLSVIALPAAAQADSADIETIVVSGPAQIQKGTDGTFQFRVTNKGPHAASGDSTSVTLSITGKSTHDTVAVSAQASNGAPRGNCAPDVSTTGGGCVFGNMAAGESILVLVTIRAGELTGPTEVPVIGSMSTGRSDLSDPNSGPNSNDDVSAPFQIVEPPADTTPPVVTAISVTGTKLTISLNEAAKLTGSLSRRTSGRRRPGRPCSTKLRTGRRCSKYVKVGNYTRQLPAGTTTVSLPKRLNGKRLKRGTYRLRFFLTDAAGNRTTTARSIRYRIR